LDLQRILEGIGHKAVSSARTHKDALKAARIKSQASSLPTFAWRMAVPALMPSTISCGPPLSAVVFVKAFPEKLSNGGGGRRTALPHPKPFREEAVKALVSQVLFFDQQTSQPNPSA
jgi:hypothetical protein